MLGSQAMATLPIHPVTMVLLKRVTCFLSVFARGVSWSPVAPSRPSTSIFHLAFFWICRIHSSSSGE